MDRYYIEVTVNESCECSNMLEAFLVDAETKEEAIEKVRLKLGRVKKYLISCVYRCSDISNGVYLIYARKK